MPVRLACGLILGGVLAGAAQAQSPSQSNAPGSFVASCGGVGTGAYVKGGETMLYGAGSGATGQFAIGSATCNSQTSGSANASLAQSISQPSESYMGNAFSDSAAASVGVKQIHLNSTMTGPTTALFPTGAGQGGWTDTVTPTGQPTGTHGLMQFKVNIDGALQASGMFARPGIFVTPYLNGSVIPQDATFLANNPDPVINDGTAGYQTRVWWDPSVGPSGAPDIDVNQTVIFDIPVTFGTPINLGVYAVSTSTLTSFGFSTAPDSTATSDFSSTISWDGVQEIDVSGVPVSYNLVTDTDSGIDWNTGLAEAVPEPGTLALLGVAVAGLGVIRRRRRA